MTMVEVRLEEVSIVDVGCDGGEEEVKKVDFVTRGCCMLLQLNIVGDVWVFACVHKYTEENIKKRLGLT